MTVLVSSDWHFSANPRDDYRWVFAERTLPKLLEKHNVELLLFLGDVCEEKDAHPAELVNRVVAVFETLADYCPIIYLQANHDWYSGPDNPFFGFLSKLRGAAISWVSKPTPLAALKNVPASVSKALNAILLPHTADFARDWGDIDFKRYDWAFAHQCFAEAHSNAGFKLGGVPLNFFPKKLKIVSGDIHRAQTVGNLTYVGSPYSIDFGDSVESRVLLWENGAFEGLPVDGPQKRLLEIRSVNDLNTKGLRVGDLLKVRVEETEGWQETVAKIRRWSDENGFVLTHVQPTRKVTASSSPRTAEAASDQELFERYASSRGLDPAIQKIGNRLL